METHHKDVNTATDLFTNMILSIADIHAPHKTIKSRENQPRWITSEFLSLVDYKHHTANVHRRRPSQYTAARKREAYLLVSKMKRKLKRGYVLEAIHDCHGDIKKTWRLIKTLWPTKNKSSKISTISDTSDPSEIANKLNDHFVKVGEKLTENMPKGDEFNINHNDPLTSFRLRNIDYKEV